MQRRRLGNTDLEVSVIALGCWPFGVDWWGHYSEPDAVRLCRFAFERGVSFFDNGDAYGNGRAEVLFSQFLRTVPRDQVQIGGKFGYDFYSDPGTPGSHRERRQDFSPSFLHKALEQSLQRLGTDYIDLYMAHNIKLPQFSDDTFAELEKLKDQGKIRAWGVSLGPAIGWREEGVRAMLDHDARAVQTVMNLFEQDPGREFLETATACGAGVLARVHDNSRILMDRVRPDEQISGSDHRKFRDEAWRVYGLKKVELIRPMARELGMTIHQFACRWLLASRALTSITGTFLTEEEIAEACEAADMPDLPAPQLAQLAREYARDWDLGEQAHPCDLKSSTDASGRVRSGYVPPPVLLA
jgi:aryl-alcohol dehydrogenase-like predicted oxidoreductase